MIDKKIDSNGNLVLASGTFDVLKDDNESEQNLRIRLQHIKGEWFLDPDSGLDMYGKILGKTFKENQAATEIRRVALISHGNINRVIKLVFTRDRANRSISLSLGVVTNNAAPLYIDREFAI